MNTTPCDTFIPPSLCLMQVSRRSTPDSLMTMIIFSQSTVIPFLHIVSSLAHL